MQRQIGRSTVAVCLCECFVVFSLFLDDEEFGCLGR